MCSVEGTEYGGSLMGLGEDFVRGRIKEEDQGLGRMTDISEQTRLRKQWGDEGRIGKGSWWWLRGRKKLPREPGASRMAASERAGATSAKTFLLCK